MGVREEFGALMGEAFCVDAGSAVRVSPASTEEVATVLRHASERGLIVRPRGAATKVGWANTVAADVELDLRRLSGVVENVWQDMTATVRAGTPWAAMQAVFAEHGQQVALDPMSGERATVGGICAANDSGAMRGRYGSLRDLVLGMTIVLSDGTIARSGGKVVKNVAGYDLPKLMIGAFGTLGVITEVNFRLHPLPRVAKSWTLRAGSPQVLHEVARSLAMQSADVSRMQVRVAEKTFAMDIELTGDALKTVSGVEHVEPAAGDVWLARERLFADPDATVLKVTSLADRVPALLRGCAELGAHCVSVTPGITWVALRVEASLALQAVEDLRARLREHGGMVVVAQMGALQEAELERWGGSPPAIAMMRAIKTEFDPTGTLNPGAFVGGI